MPSYRLKEDQNLWNFLFSMFFLAVSVAAVYALYDIRGSLPTSVPLWDAVLMALAVFRITRLMVYDKIMRWFREIFADVREFEREDALWIEIRPYGSGIRHTIYDLLQCPWCVGFWSSLVVSFAYFAFPWAWTPILFLALAGAGSLLQVAANGIGWRAENLKLEAHERERHIQL